VALSRREERLEGRRGVVGRERVRGDLERVRFRVREGGSAGGVVDGIAAVVGWDGMVWCYGLVETIARSLRIGLQYNGACWCG
jgi:hypothetical protein